MKPLARLHSGTEAAGSPRAVERKRIRGGQVWNARRSLSSGPRCDEETLSCFALRRQIPASFGSCRRVSPRAGILLSLILFSPRSLLPGQMHTNAFRSSTDKEWTRFRGSNVSGLWVKQCARLPMRMWATGTNFNSRKMSAGSGRVDCVLQRQLLAKKVTRFLFRSVR